MNNISIIISSIGKSKKLDELCTYLTNNYKQDEIILVDNSSDKKLYKNYHNNKYIKYIHEPNVGLSNARNRGAKESSNSILLFLDDDIMPSKSFSKIIKKYKEDNQIEKIGIVGGKIKAYEIPIYLPKKYHYMVGEKNFGNKTKILNKNENLGGCCLMISKKNFYLVNGFNNEYGHKDDSIGANEDVLIQNQLKKLKLNIVYEPEFDVIHFWEGTYDMIQQRLEIQGKNDYLLDKRYYYFKYILKLIKYHIFIFFKKNSEDLTDNYDIVRYKAYVQNRGRNRNK